MYVRSSEEVVQRRVLRHTLAGNFGSGDRHRRVWGDARGGQTLLLCIDARLGEQGRQMHDIVKNQLSIHQTVTCAQAQ